MTKSIPLALAIALCSCGPTTRDKPTQHTDDNNGVIDNNGATHTATGGTTGSNNAPTNNATTPTNNATTPTNNATASANNDTNNSTGSTVGGTDNGSNNSTGGTNNATTNTNNATTNNAVCPPEPGFHGQIGSAFDHGGGVLSAVGPQNDAGLAAIAAAVPPEPDDATTVAIDEGTAVLTPPLAVTGALVTATAYGNQGFIRFWLQDSSTMLQVYLSNSSPVTSVHVGDKVSFTALAVANFEGHPQISALQGFVVDSSNNGVQMRTVGTSAVTMADYGRNVLVAGQLSGGVDCGGATCYDLAHPGGIVIYRTKSELTNVGDCVTFAGPAYSFPGPRQSSTTPAIQVDAINYDWTYRGAP